MNLVFNPVLREMHHSRALHDREPCSYLYKIGAEILLDVSYRKKHSTPNTLLYGHFPGFIEQFSELARNITHHNIKCSTNNANSVLSDACPEENIPLTPDQVELALSNLTLHFANDFYNVLQNYKTLLKKDGLFAATLLGDRSLFELREAFAYADQKIYGGLYARVMPMLSSETVLRLMVYAGFQDVVMHVEKFHLQYTSTVAMLRELKTMGFGNFLTAGQGNPLSTAALTALEEYYSGAYCSKGRLNVTLDILVLSGFK